VGFSFVPWTPIHRFHRGKSGGRPKTRLTLDPSESPGPIHSWLTMGVQLWPVLTGHQKTAEGRRCGSLAQLHHRRMAVAGAFRKNVVVEGRAEPAAEQNAQGSNGPCLRQPEPRSWGASRAVELALERLPAGAGCVAGLGGDQAAAARIGRRARYWRPPRRRAKSWQRSASLPGAAPLIRFHPRDRWIRGRCRGV